MSSLKPWTSHNGTQVHSNPAFVCRLDNDVTQEELLGSQASPRLCAVCCAVADAVENVAEVAPPANQKQFEVCQEFSMSQKLAEGFAAFLLLRASRT